MKDIDENGVDRMERFQGYSQRFTQFSVADEVYRETLEYMKHLRQQRDEARREVCDMVARTRRKMGVRGQTIGMDRVAGKEIAAERGWDCFAEKEGGGA